MQRLYNEYGVAVGEDADAIRKYMDAVADTLWKEYVEEFDYCARDVSSYAHDCLATKFSSLILTRAVRRHMMEAKKSPRRTK